MEKAVMMDGRPVRFRATGGTLYRYKAQFGREFLADISGIYEFREGEAKKAASLIKEGGDESALQSVFNLEKFKLETIYDILWTLAKTAAPSIPPPVDWLDGFEKFPVLQIFAEVQDLIVANLKVDSKNG